MEIKNRRDLESVIEEVVYLTRNAAFEGEMKRIRDKYGLLSLEEKQKHSSGTVKIRSNFLQDFKQDVLRVARQCRGYKSKFRNKFIEILNVYIFTGRVSEQTEDLQSSELTLSVREFNERVAVTVFGDFDTPIQDMIKIIKKHKRFIKERQKSIGWKKMNVSPYFKSNLEIWDYFNGKRHEISKILDLIVEGKIEKPASDADNKEGIKKIINRVQERIEKSFSGN